MGDCWGCGDRAGLEVPWVPWGRNQLGRAAGEDKGGRDVGEPELFMVPISFWGSMILVHKIAVGNREAKKEDLRKNETSLLASWMHFSLELENTAMVHASGTAPSGTISHR